MRVPCEAKLSRDDRSLLYRGLAISNTCSHAKNRNDPVLITWSKVAFPEVGFSAVAILGGGWLQSPASDGPPCDGIEMMHKAWSSIEEVPYCFWRSSLKFQNHTGWKIYDLNPIWVRLLGRSQALAAIKSLRFALFHTNFTNILNMTVKFHRELKHLNYSMILHITK